MVTLSYLSRPIVSIVITIFISLLGLGALRVLPIELYPKLAPTSISVNANYPGADAETVEQSVATALEQQVSGLEHVSYMTSSNSNDGSMSLNVVFDPESDPNEDQILLQLRTNRGESQLPDEVRASGLTIQKTAGLPLLVFALSANDEAYNETFLSNYARITLNDQLMRESGVSSVGIMGAGKYAMRIWVKPDQLAKYELTVPDVSNAVRSQNRVNPAGQIGGEPTKDSQKYTLTIRARGRLQSVEEFNNIIVKSNDDGSFVRLKDIAKVELGSDSYDLKSRYNGKPTALLCIYQAPGSNALETSQAVKDKMEELSKSFPTGVSYKLALDTTKSISEGIHEIILTLVEALILVLLVVFMFLQGWRPTLMPLLAIPVSLLGTFCLFPFVDYSVNLLSLFGLVLAIGLVVDDPIVVVESIEHHLDKGFKITEAISETMKQVRSPIIATTLVLIAVFAPTAFIPGISGQMFKQFSVTVCVAVIISAFNSLTLTPALASIFLKNRKANDDHLVFAIKRKSSSFINSFTTRYVNLCDYFICKPVYFVATIVSVLFLSFIVFRFLPSTFIPQEDQGYLMVGIQLPAGSSMKRTSIVSAEIESRILSIEGVDGVATIVGDNMASGVKASYSAFFFVALKNWNDRESNKITADSLLLKINTLLQSYSSAYGFAFSPPAIPGVGTSNGISMMVEDRGGYDATYLKNNLDHYMEKLRGIPELAFVSSSSGQEVPQIIVDVKRDKSLRHGVNNSDIFETLQSFMGSSFVNYFNDFGRQWPVIIEADPEYRDSYTRLGQFYVRNKTGKMVPLDTLTNINEGYGPEVINRHNLFRAAKLQAIPSPNVSSAAAMIAMEKIFRESLPAEMAFEYTDMSYQEKSSQSGIGILGLSIIALISVYLILAAQYESWTTPLSVLIVSPIAIFGGLLATAIAGLQFSIYSQIGIIMLIGLSAKNSILIVEYAKNKYLNGSLLRDAALEAASLRFRPILMTAFAFLFGVLPLVFSSGAGAVARRSVGVAMFGGMSAATLLSLLFIPCSFYFVEIISLRFNKSLDLLKKFTIRTSKS